MAPPTIASGKMKNQFSGGLLEVITMEPSESRSSDSAYSLNAKLSRMREHLRKSGTVERLHMTKDQRVSPKVLFVFF